MANAGVPSGGFQHGLGTASAHFGRPSVTVWENFLPMQWQSAAPVAPSGVVPTTVSDRALTPPWQMESAAPQG